MDDLLKKPLATLVLILVIIFTGLLVYASYWAEERAASIEGPWLMVQDTNKDLWILAEPNIYELSPQGSLIKTVDLKAIGIHGVVSDFLPLPSGGFLIAIADTQQILEYSASDTLEGGFSIKPLGKENFNGAFKFAVAPDTGDYYVADTLEHRILVFDREGNPKGGFGSLGSNSRSFDFPNRILFGTDGLMYIADTNNHRIDVFNEAGEPFTSINTVKNIQSNPNEWPTDFAFGPGQYLTVVNNGPELKGGDVVVVDRSGRTIAQIYLPPGTDPEYVVVRDSDILITDRAMFRIIRASFDGQLLGFFGGTKIQSIFNGESEQKSKYNRLAWESRTGLIILLILILVALLVQQRIGKPTKKNVLSGQLDLRPIPFQLPTVRQKILLWAVRICRYFLYIALFWVIYRINYTPLTIYFLLQNLLAILLAIAIIWLSAFSKLLTEGIFVNDQPKRAKKIFIRYADQFGKILKTGEKIRFYTSSMKIVQKHGTISRLLFSIGFSGVDIELLFGTTERLLIFKKSLSERTIKQVQEISYNGIKDIKVEPPERGEGFLFKLFGIHILTTSITDHAQPLQWRIFSKSIADELKTEIEQRKTSVSPSFQGIRDLCMNCFSGLIPNQKTCPKCGKPVTSKWKAVYLSLICPGLGQLQRQNLFKGLLFLTLFTLYLIALLKDLVIWYWGTADVNSTLLIIEFAIVLLVWIVSAIDAYYSSK